MRWALQCPRPLHHRAGGIGSSPCSHRGHAQLLESQYFVLHKSFSICCISLWVFKVLKWLFLTVLSSFTIALRKEFCPAPHFDIPEIFLIYVLHVFAVNTVLGKIIIPAGIAQVPVYPLAQVPGCQCHGLSVTPHCRDPYPSLWPLRLVLQWGIL